MPTATELNATDIADLKGAIKEVVGSISDSRVEAARNHAEVIRRIDLLTSRVETYASISKWALGVVIPIILTLVGAAIASSYYMGGMNQRLAQVEQHQVKGAR